MLFLGVVCSSGDYVDVWKCNFLSQCPKKKKKKKIPECMIMLVGYGPCMHSGRIIKQDCCGCNTVCAQSIPCGLQWESRHSPVDKHGSTSHLWVVCPSGIPLWYSHRSTALFFKTEGCCCVPLWKSQEHNPPFRGDSYLLALQGRVPSSLPTPFLSARWWCGRACMSTKLINSW